MTTHTDSATAELSVGARMEPEFELTDDQWNLISDLFADRPPDLECVHQSTFYDVTVSCCRTHDRGLLVK